jgi:acetyltransferase-like isoleucine patch superfamily enzyme
VRPRGIHPTAVVSERAVLGENVSIGAYAIVEAGVTVGANSFVGPHCILGEPGAGYYQGDDTAIPTSIGEGAIIRSHTVVYAGVRIGPNLRTGHHATVREETVAGRNFQVGTGSDVQGRCSIGDYVRLHSRVFVPEHTVLHDYVWLFPGALITNDPHPPSDGATVGPTIGAYAVIGAGSVILPSLHIGKDAVVAAASVVTRDVAEGQLVVGAPARARGNASELVKSRDPKLERPYPWREHFSRGFPWEKPKGGI